MRCAAIKWAACVIVLIMVMPAVSLASTEISDAPGAQPVYSGITGLTPPVGKPSAPLRDEPRWVSGGLVYIIVQSSLYNTIPDSVDMLEYDIENHRNAEYEVEVLSGSWTSHTQVKSTLQSGYSLGMTGAILIGNIPTPWYRMLNPPDWGSNYWETFPIDLFYMDLDGAWGSGTGTEGDPYNTHTAGTGDLQPEIWVGRLKADTLDGLGTESQIIEYSLEKNHYYSLGMTQRQNRAYCFVDDDWYDWADEWGGNIGLVYPSVTVVKELAQTVKTTYMNALPLDYEWLSLFSHTGIYYHQLKTPTGYQYIYNNEIAAGNCQALFYNLFCCGAAKYSTSGYIQGYYAFANEGLMAIGSAKTGSMLEFQHFYGPLSEGACIGEAFRDWMEINQEIWGDESRAWFYGMNIAGDPTLETGGYEPPYELNLAGKAAGSWAFASFPVAVSGHIEAVLDDGMVGDAGTGWDVAKTWDNANKRWLTYRKGSESNTFSDVDNTMGIWLHLTANSGDQLLTMADTGLYPGTMQIQLRTGWNMVGYPSATARPGSATLPAQADRVSVWQAASPYIADSTPGAVTMSHGNAYWVRVTSDCTWTVQP